MRWLVVIAIVFGAREARAETVCAEGETVDGIDVSYWQGAIDWPAVAADGIEFAFIRASHGLGTIDTRYQENWAGARAAGIMRGTYQYFSPGEDVIAQADLMLEMMGPLEPDDLPPVIDVEETNGVAPEVIAERVGQWLEYVEAATGRTPIIYSGKYFWNDNVGSDAYRDYPLWIPQYGPVCPDLPDPWTDWVFFQTSSTGRVAGITGNVDTDLFNGDLAALAAFAGAEPPAPCGVVATAGGTIDDGQVCFRGGGPPASLRTVTDAGEGGSLIWTYTTDAAEDGNYGRWTLHLEQAGRYRVEVYTDAAYAQSRQAAYRIRHGGAELEVVIDQTAVDGWQSLGELDFAAGGDQWIHVGDATGEPLAGMVQLVFDAVRVTRIEPEPEPEPEDDLDGGCTTTGDGGGGLLVVLALASSIVTRRRRRVAECNDPRVRQEPAISAS